MKFSSRWKAVLAGLAGAAGLTGVLTTGGGKKPAPPAEPSAATVSMWDRTCRALYEEELQREIDPSGLEGCLLAARNGATDVTLRAALRASDEYKTLQERLKKRPLPDPVVPVPDPVVALTPLHVSGRFFVDGRGNLYRPRWASALAILSRPDADRDAVLEEIKALGFDGVRVFGGRLSWANQSAAQAEARLPALLTAAAARGLRVYVSAITDSKDGGYDVEAHLRGVAGQCLLFISNCLLEVANEVGHPTQSEQVNDVPRLRAMAARVIPNGLPYALGAPLGTDEPDAEGKYPSDGGSFNSSHLDRGRDKWNQIRRLREVEALSAATKKPAISGEPIGAAEQSIPGRRESDPAFFFAMGALCRGFEIGCVWHSEDGLHARPLGPNQRACADAFMAGWRSLATAERLSFVNAKWANSPIEDADFTKVVRAYSFVSGSKGWLVLLGLSGEPAIRWGGGWKAARVVAERPGVQIVEICSVAGKDIQGL